MFIRNRSNTNSVHISARYKNLGSEYNVKTKKSPIEYMIKKYGTSSFVNRVKSKIKRILKR